MNDELNERVLGCIYGQYPWDDWQRRALERGVSQELATLGRAVMREAYQHQWEPLLQQHCGWEDDGETMIELAKKEPVQASFAWQKLLDTDGCRGSYDPQTGELVGYPYGSIPRLVLFWLTTEALPRVDRATERG